MRDEYNFSQGEKNPYSKDAQTAVTIHLDKAALEYFKSLAKQVNLPYQTLISSYLTECATHKKKPGLANWPTE